jgi:hypothetical protein
VKSVRLEPGFGQAASHLIVEFLGGAKFQVMREAARPRLHYILPARRTVPPRRRTDSTSGGTSPLRYRPGVHVTANGCLR